MTILTNLFTFILLHTATVATHHNIPASFVTNPVKQIFAGDTISMDSTNLFINHQMTPKLISDQFEFTEGPAIDRQGNIYFTDQPNNKIWKYDNNGNLSLFKNNAGRSNGTYVDPKGNLITCADEQDELWSISPEGKVTVLVKNFEGHRLNGPNDLWVSPKGDIYFTDPYYQRSYWKRTQPDIEGQKVYLLAKNAKQPIIIADDLIKPNGIAGTADGKIVYIADIEANKTYQYTVDGSGKLMNKKLFIAKGADGITMDNQGNLYLAGNGVTVVNPSGKIIAHIAVPQPWTANLCFGGKKKDILFITASKAIYMLPMNVHGIE